MTDYSSFQLPPPADWPAFERLCHALWIRIWKAPDAQLHGRSGQQQLGVDIYGVPAGTTKPHGIQCKSKDRLIGSELTEKEVLTTVEEAKKFSPALAELIIATSAESDVKLQALARRLTEENRAFGLFDVHIFGWREIVARLGEFPDLVERFYGHVLPSTGVALNAKTQDRFEALHAETHRGQTELSQKIAQLTATLARPADGPAHAQLDICRDLLDSHAYRAALVLLEKIREREWADASSALRFRIATNLGAAHLGLGNYRMAGERLLEAFEFDSASDKAMANRALGYLLVDQPVQALAAARRAVEQHPLSGRAWTALVNILGRVEPETPIPDSPPELADDPELLLVRADALSMRNDWLQAEALLRRLIDLKPAASIPKSRLAEVLMAEATAGGKFYAGVSYSEAVVTRLREANNLLRQAWAEIKATDLAHGSLHVVQNLCALSAVLGSPHEAESVLNEALAIAPDDHGLLTWKVRTAAARGDSAAAARALAKLPRDSIEEYALLEAATLRASKNHKRALEVLEEFIRTAGATELAIDARCLFADLLCEADLANAEVRFNALPNAGSERVARSTVMFARALREHGREQAAKPYLTLAQSQLADSEESRGQLMLADALADFGEYTAAVAIYENFVSSAADTPSLREYARCLFELDQRQRLTKLLASLPAEIASKPHYQYVSANLAVRSGDFKSAREQLERCLAIDPGHKAARLLWAEVSLRSNDAQAVVDWLATIDSRSLELTLEQLLQLGPMFHTVGQSERAIEVFYEAMRRFPHDPRPHLGFTTSMLFSSSDKWASESGVACDVHMACALRDAEGRENIYILENLPHTQLLSNEVTVSSPIGERLVGRKVGEAVTFHSSGLATHERTVAWVKHKYVHALQESMTNFNTRFPESTGLVEVKLPTSGTPDEQLAPIKHAINQRAERARRVLDTYREGLPLAALGVLMGRTSIETWRGLVGNREQPILVCGGSEPERKEAFALLDNKEHRYILEPIALFELHAMGALEAVETVCGGLAITQATIEELRGLIRDLQLHPEGYMTVLERQGEYLRNDVSAGDVERERQSLQALLDWTQARCDIVPAVPRSDLKPRTADSLYNALGPAVYDTLLAANGGGFVLISDDWNLRRLAKGELQIVGVWIQPILMKAHEAQRLAHDQYKRAVALLAGWQHQFTSLNADVLLFAAEQGGWKITTQFEAIVSSLSLTHSDFASNVRVLLTFFQLLWQRRPGATAKQARAVMDATLKGVDPGRSPENVRFFRFFESANQTGRLPRDAWLTIHDWYQRHLLAPVFSFQTPWGRSR